MIKAIFFTSSLQFALLIYAARARRSSLSIDEVSGYFAEEMLCKRAHAAIG
jgi:hypothetical protein